MSANPNTLSDFEGLEGAPANEPNPWDSLRDYQPEAQSTREDVRLKADRETLLNQISYITKHEQEMENPELHQLVLLEALSQLSDTDDQPYSTIDQTMSNIADKSERLAQAFAKQDLNKVVDTLHQKQSIANSYAARYHETNTLNSDSEPETPTAPPELTLPTDIIS